MAKLEICCFNVESAIVAARAGADRIELCTDRGLGGTTPPLEWVMHVKSQVSIPVRVMIRPRGGDFVYSDEEFAAMLADIDRYRNHVDGFVFGLLDTSRQVDVSRTHTLVQQAQLIPCTFHRAIDDADEIERALDDILQTGCDTVLTSGGHTTAHMGKAVLSNLVHRARKRIDIMPGGGVRVDNVGDLRFCIAAPWYHTSAAVIGSDLPDAESIRQMKSVLATG